jgi:hypothetical protein
MACSEAPSINSANHPITYFTERHGSFICLGDSWHGSGTGEARVETPSDINAVLKHLLRNEDADASAPSRLAAEDEAYLTRLVAAIRSGKSAVLIVEDSDEKLKYMFSNATRAEAVSMLGKIIEATGRRIANGDD